MSPQPSGAQHVPLLPVQFLAMFQEGNIINSIVLFNVCHVCSSICIFFIKNYFAFYASPFFFQEESWWRLTSIDTPLVSLMLSLPFPLCGNKVSWGEENFVLREAWKLYLDDGQFEKLDKVVADCENADDNYEPAARHLKHEQVFSKMQSFDHIAYKTYNTLTLPLPSNFDIIAQWSSVYTYNLKKDLVKSSFSKSQPKSSHHIGPIPTLPKSDNQLAWVIIFLTQSHIRFTTSVKECVSDKSRQWLELGQIKWK